MTKKENNYAFIDSQNVHKGTQSLGWELDWKKFRIYLQDKYSVSSAFLFLGFMPDKQRLYEYLQGCGYILIFKPLVFATGGAVKGNCDADLVLHSITKMTEYDKAIIVTSYGDFYSLVRYLYENNRLEMVLSSYVRTCSKLLKKESKEKINYMSNLRNKISRKGELK